MKSSLPAVALVTLTALACLARADVDRVAFMHLARTTVRIEALAPGSHYNMGTGVIVGPGRVVTSCHVTGPAPSVRVLYGGLRYPVQLQRADVHHDLCMLDVPDLEGPVARIGSALQLKLGDAVVAMGYTGGRELQFADGVVRELNLEHQLPIIKSSTAFNSGASGGGLFNAQGELIGILTFRLRGAEDCYYSMPVDHFKSWITSREGFEPMRVLDRERPVWMEPREAQPAFLQAAALEAQHDWNALGVLARSWLSDEPDSAYAWLALGKVAVALHQSGEAVQAFTEATRREPRLAEAWFSLARSYADTHQAGALADARHHLAILDASLDARLDEAQPGASP